MNRTINEKEKLRALYLNRRRELDKDEARNKSKKIVNTLIQSKAYQNSKTVHCYVSIDKQKEVETKNLILRLLDSGKNVVVPKIVGDVQLRHIQIYSMDELKENEWGVAEPADGHQNIVNVDELDLVIVPMVAGDHYRNRLGYGKGFYDRFLKGTEAFKIGLLYELQVHQEPLITEDHDVTLDLLITENGQI